MALIGEEASDDQIKLFAFPRRVHLVAKSKGYTRRDMEKLFLFGWMIAFCIVAFIGRSFFISNGISLWIFWSAYLILNGLLVSLYIRYMVIDETSKKREMEEESSEAFNRYCKVRSLDPVKTLERFNREVNIYQYATGGVYTLLRLTHGANSTKKSLGNSEMLTDFYKYLYANSVNFDCYVSDEEFSESIEASRHLGVIARCEDKTLANTMARITKELYSVTETQSNVECMYILLRGRTEGFSEVIESAVEYLYSLHSVYSNSFRNIESLSPDQYLRYVKYFHGLDGIDPTRIRIDNYNEDKIGILSMDVRIYMIEYEDGDVKVDNTIVSRHLEKIKKVN